MRNQTRDFFNDEKKKGKVSILGGEVNRHERKYKFGEEAKQGTELKWSGIKR